jgi:hypothetical protein
MPAIGTNVTDDPVLSVLKVYQFIVRSCFVSKLWDEALHTRDIHYVLIRHEVSIVKFYGFHSNRSSFARRKQSSTEAARSCQGSLRDAMGYKIWLSFHGVCVYVYSNKIL